jgi:hypothetical protein
LFFPLAEELMKIAYFDCSFGAAGDMLLGAFLQAGLPFERWHAELAKIALPAKSFEIRISDVMRCTIASKKLDVLCLEEQFVETLESGAHSHSSGHGKHEHEHGHGTGREHTHGHKHEHEHAHGTEHEHTHEHKHEHEHAHGTEHEHAHEHKHEHAHEHKHEHDHAHDHGNGQEHSHEHEHAHGRNLPAIIDIIQRSEISARAKTIAVSIFEKLARAEATVHGTTPDAVHFHEVGAIDAIVDIVGFAIAYDLMGIERSYVSAVPLGSGKVQTQHGLFPIPGPATVNLISEAGLPVAASTFTHECTTPTAAAIFASVCHSGGAVPAMKILSSGYGAGTFNPDKFPNVCRVMIGETTEHSSFAQATETVVVIETNLDDLSPQVLSFAVERLFQAGALDVSVTPVMMKKGRSGHLLTVVCSPENREKLQDEVLAHTSSLGVRSHLCERLTLAREWISVSLEHGDKVRVKLGRDRNGRVINAQPEYEDCAVYALKFNLPLKEVMAQVLTHLNRDT